MSAPPAAILPLNGALKIADLFCGCGGLTLGAREAARSTQRELKIQFAVDHFGSALAVYRANFGVDEKTAVAADITDLLPGEPESPISAQEQKLVDDLGSIDIVLAGPPCQGHSDLNNLSRRDDERNKLYLKVVRFVEIVLPKVVVIENVPTVVHDRNDVVGSTKTIFSKLGYHVKETIVSFLDLGVPQHRKRHILLAKQDSDTDFPESFSAEVANGISIRDYIADLADDCDRYDDVFRTASRMSPKNKKRTQHLFEHDLFDLPNELRPKCHRDGNHSYKSMYGRLHIDKPAQTITTGFGSMGQGRYVHPTRPRVITPHEAARIQGFPDFFSFDSVKYRGHLQEMIGNAVPPQLTAQLVAHMLEIGEL